MAASTGPPGEPKISIGTPGGATLPRPSLSSDVCSLVQTLQQAIRFGDEEQAKKLATQLAKRKAAVSVDMCFDKPVYSSLDEDIRVKVYVEDKDSSGVCVVLKLKPLMTIRQLKSKMLIEYSFPPEVQKWIVGKRIAADDDTLAKCGIKSSGSIMYLYLISPNSLGLTKNKIMQKYRHLLPADSPLLEGQTSSQQNNSRPGGVSMQRVEVAEPPRVASSAAGDAARPLEGASSQNEVPASNTPTRTATGGNKRENPPTNNAVNKQPVGWECVACTFFNVPTRPGCEICGHPRPSEYEVPTGYVIPQVELDRITAEQEAERMAREAEEEENHRKLAESMANYEHMLSVDNQDFVPNMENFDCPVCFDNVNPGEGVILRECLHKFCKECLSGQVEHADTPEVKCPYQDDDYACSAALQEREVKAIVTPQIYQKFLDRSLNRAENVAQNSYHCKTADCRGWCIYEDEANFFTCPICRTTNCLTCKAIHEGMNCRQYQDDLVIRAGNDVAAKQTHETIQRMLAGGEAIHCPSCNIVVQKKDGCDWVMCTMCQTEICWVTKGPRWGPLGEGDTSAGCRCREDGNPCHPDCVNCH